MSEQYSLSKVDKKKWIANQLDFLKPLVLIVAAIYFPPILMDLANPEHIITLQDFIPSNLVYLAIAYYLVNASYDIIRKWAGETK